MNEPALWGLRRKLLDLGAKLQLAHPAVRRRRVRRAHRDIDLFHKPAVSGVFAEQPS